MNERKGKSWSRVDYATLRTFAKDHTAKEIAEMIGRTPSCLAR